MQSSMRLCLLSRATAAAASAPGKSNLSTSVSVKGSGSQEGGQQSFFGSLFGSTKVELQHDTHSHSLGSKECLVLLQTHDVRPDRSDDYERAHRSLTEFLAANTDLKGRSTGHFQVILGQDDQYIHVWKYDGGNAEMDSDLGVMHTSPEYKRLHQEVSKHVVSRRNQVLMPFDFWPAVASKTTNHIYEMRSYNLKPGTMIEWGNYWARAIRMRDYKHDEAFLGMFSQIGELYNVKHVWCYGSLQERKEAREAVWSKQQQQQWRRVIEGTMPLIQDMSSRVMVPLEYSPTK